MNLTEYAQYRETKVHEQPDFAYNTYLCTIPQDFEKVNPHWHDQMELIYVKKGTGRITVDLLSYRAPAGSIVIVHPGQLHSIERASNERMEYENIIFSLSMLESIDDDWCRKKFYDPLEAGTIRLPAILRPEAKLYRRAAGCIDAADAACGERQEGYPLIVKAELQLFFSILYEKRTVFTKKTSSENTEKLKKILSFIQLHYTEKLTVNEAAASAGYSASHFMRFFRENAGQTFIEYLLDYRLTAAARRLAETDELCGTAAMESGFDNISYFCRTFRKKYGVSPGVFRKRSRGA